MASIINLAGRALRYKSVSSGTALINQSRAFSSLNEINWDSLSAKPSFLKNTLIVKQPVRYSVSSFFNKKTASSLWKSVSSVSPAGKKRGRGKIAKKMVKDLNRGQVIGIGKDNIRWPGLSAPILRGRELVERTTLPIDPEYKEKLVKARENVHQWKREKLSPIDRGWSGGHPGGRKIGPPDPVGDYDFKDFESIILSQKHVIHMTRHFGRYKTVSTICCTGNSNGLIGYALANSLDAKSAIRKAKNRAAKKLMYIQRYEDRTSDNLPSLT